MLLIGESETLEFRERLSDKRTRLAKTAVAFANTRGGTIVFGVDDDHQVVGCETKGIADTVTNILRSICDPLPEFVTEILCHENKQLLLVRVAVSKGPVYTVKELGPFIRSNATNRAPTSREIEFLLRRLGSAPTLLPPWWS
jgi:ATP-dependent DNA helicase RecG